MPIAARTVARHSARESTPIMRRLQEEPFDLRVPPEELARWALETPATAQEATYSAVVFALRAEYAGLTLLPAPDLIIGEPGQVDPDGFLRLPRGGLEHLKVRSARAAAWMDLCIFFRERFPSAAARKPPASLDALAQAFSNHANPVEASIDLLVRESIWPEIEELLQRTVTWPPLQALLKATRGSEAQRSAEARRLAAALMGELKGKLLWQVRKRLVSTATRAVLGARPLLEELERGGLRVDRGRAAKGFARRLGEAVGELPGDRVVPQVIVDKLAGIVSGESSSADLVDPEPQE
jgi:hypothetical protein